MLFHDAHKATNKRLPDAQPSNPGTSERRRPEAGAGDNRRKVRSSQRELVIASLLRCPALERVAPKA
jgi:hypothetical protein